MAISTRLRADRARLLGRRRVLVLAGVAAVSLAVGGLAVSRSSILHARAIEVQGAGRMSAEQVARIAGVSERTNVLWLDEEAVERRLEARPWIAEAEVDVRWPWTIAIRVSERTPVAVVRDGVGGVLVAGDGTILGRAGRGRRLPVIELSAVGPQVGQRPSAAGAARALDAMEPALRSRVLQVDVLADGTLELELAGGVRVRYGAPVDTGAKAAALGDVLAWAEASGERLSLVTVTAPGAPAVVPAG